jgi:hypothetical protein
MGQVRQTIPNSIGEYDKTKGKDEMTDDVKRYTNLKPADTGVQVGKLVIGKGTKENAKSKRTFTPTEKSKTVPMYELPSDAWIETRNHTIVGFGKDKDNNPYIRTIKKVDDEEIREVRKATREDMSVLRNKMKDTYYNYFEF